MSKDFSLPKLNRESTWKDIFDTIDSNFDKMLDYINSLGGRVLIDRYTTEQGDQEFTLTRSYNTKRNCLAVYRNGVRQWLGTGFLETGLQSFKLTEPCDKNDYIVAVYTQHYSLADQTTDELNNIIRELESDMNSVRENIRKSELTLQRMISMYNESNDYYSRLESKFSEINTKLQEIYSDHVISIDDKLKDLDDKINQFSASKISKFDIRLTKIEDDLKNISLKVTSKSVTLTAKQSTSFKINGIEDPTAHMNLLYVNDGSTWVVADAVCSMSLSTDGNYTLENNTDETILLKLVVI